MKKIYHSFLSLVTFLSIFLQTRFVYADLCPPGDFAHLCELKADKAGGIAGTIISALIILAVILTLLYLVYGGIKWITSGGEKAKIDAARSHITAAVVGLVIALLAYVIVGIVLGFFKLDVRQLKVPTLLD